MAIASNCVCIHLVHTHDYCSNNDCSLHSSDTTTAHSAFNLLSIITTTTTLQSAKSVADVKEAVEDDARLDGINTLARAVAQQVSG
jgi:hypothetical protein